MVNKDSHFADYVRLCTHTYTRTQQSLPPLWAAMIRTGISCSKISCYMRDSACRWLIVENSKIIPSYVKIF